MNLKGTHQLNQTSNNKTKNVKRRKNEFEILIYFFFIKELHWKVSSFLVKNYDHILLPEFKTSQIVTKSKKLCKMTKRLMNMFSFYKFKEKLSHKCSVYGKELYIVDESYTSKTCGLCGTLSNVGGSEVYKCKSCKVEIDRDINGSRNIFLKNFNFNPTLGVVWAPL